MKLFSLNFGEKWSGPNHFRWPKQFLNDKFCYSQLDVAFIIARNNVLDIQLLRCNPKWRRHIIVHGIEHICTERGSILQETSIVIIAYRVVYFCGSPIIGWMVLFCFFCPLSQTVAPNRQTLSDFPSFFDARPGIVLFFCWAVCRNCVTRWQTGWRQPNWYASCRSVAGDVFRLLQPLSPSENGTSNENKWELISPSWCFDGLERVVTILSCLCNYECYSIWEERFACYYELFIIFPRLLTSNLEKCYNISVVERIWII